LQEDEEQQQPLLLLYCYGTGGRPVMISNSFPPFAPLGTGHTQLESLTTNESFYMHALPRICIRTSCQIQSDAPLSTVICATLEEPQPDARENRRDSKGL
jgi:hypothetical protein